MYKNILIATDGSELADKAVLSGLAFAKAIDASVKIITVTESLPDTEIAAQIEAGNTQAIETYNTLAEDKAKNILSAVASTAKKIGLTFKTIHISARHPAEAIITCAGTNECDLIIMASHGRRGFKKLLLGSVANEVITHSTVPVLIYR